MSSIQFLRIAIIITGTHGLDGRLKVHIITDNPGRFDGSIPVYVNIRGNYKKFNVDEFIPTRNRSGIIRFRELKERKMAEAISGCEVFIHVEEAEASRKNLDEDTFFYYDIIGCSVFCEGKYFGVVEEIIEAGANDILVIVDENSREYMVPFVAEMVDTSAIGKSRIDISPVDGLFDIQE